MSAVCWLVAAVLMLQPLLIPAQYGFADEGNVGKDEPLVSIDSVSAGDMEGVDTDSSAENGDEVIVENGQIDASLEAASQDVVEADATEEADSESSAVSGGVSASSVGEMRSNSTEVASNVAGDADAQQVAEESESGNAERAAGWATEAFLHSWRYSSRPGISFLSKSSGISWSKDGNGYVASNGMMVSGVSAIGIDVSEWNKSIDWKKVKASGIDYAIIRCGYGSTGNDWSDTTQDDDYFIQNIKGARDAGLKIGIYLYSYAINVSDARNEAEHVLACLNRAGISPTDLAFPIYYDLEEEGKSKKDGGSGKYVGLPVGINAAGEEVPLTNKMLAQFAKTFCGAISDAGFTPGVYANLNWWNNYLTDSSFNNWSRWVAQYPVATGSISCDYAGEYDMWQCMSDGSVDGISGNVDINFWYGDVPAGGGLYSDGNGLRFLRDDGTYLYSSWKSIDGEKYYFNDNGYAVRYSQVIGGKRYYFDSDYTLCTGWVRWSAGGKSYFSPKHNGAAARGWWTIDGKKYYFDANDSLSRAVTFSRDIDGKLYYFNSEGQRCTGWVNWNAGGRSYFSPKHNGAAAKGWWIIDGKKYYFNPNSNLKKAATYSNTIGGKLYYFNAKGQMVKGWVIWNTGGRSYFTSSGAAAKGWQVIGGKKYYFKPGDKLRRAATYSNTIGGKLYYFNAKGQMVKGWVIWNSGGRSYFSSSGAAAKGWWTIGGERYYFKPSDSLRRAAVGTWKLSGKTYYFNSKGQMFNDGWLRWKADGKWS